MKAVTVTHDLQIGFTELEESLHKSAGAYVGGWIEIVRPRGLQRPYVMLVNEEFLLLGLPLNEIGSYLYQTHLHGQPICGNFLIMREEGENLAGLTDSEILQVMGAMQKVKDLLMSDVWRRGKTALDDEEG